MSSTLWSLAAQIKQNPTQLKLLTTILQELLSPKHLEQQKQRVTKQVISIIAKIEAKINEKKQASTYKYLGGVKGKCMEVMVHCLEASQGEGVTGWYELMWELLRGSSEVKRVELVRVLADYLIGEGIGQVNELQNGELLNLVLTSINNEQIRENTTKILNFLLKIEHFTNIRFDQATKQTSQTKLRYTFQYIFVNCLEIVQKLPEEEQATIYNKIGDKVYSKLATPLSLAEFLLNKIKNEEENPIIVIEVLACLFILVGKYGLQLQKFYENLQRIIAKKRPYNTSLFRLNNSKRFFKLVEAAMRSSKVPFKNILNLSRLLLQAIPNQKGEFIFWVLSFFVNLVKKHRQLQANLAEFPQIEALKYHYSPRVRALVKQLSKNMNKSQYLEIEDFSKISCRKLRDLKLEQIANKMDSCEEVLQFKIPKQVHKL